jgi:hypothetical protein
MHVKQPALSQEDIRLQAAVRNGDVNDVRKAVHDGGNPRLWNDSLITDILSNDPNRLAVSMTGFENQAAILKYLVEQGCDVNANNGAALKTAIYRENASMVKTLIEEYGADPDPKVFSDHIMQEMNFKTVILAAQKSNNYILKILLKNGAKPQPALHTAIERQDLGALYILDEAGCNFKKDKNEAFFQALLHDQLKMDFEVKDQNEKQLKQAFKIIECLLEKGAFPYDRNRCADTILRGIDRNWVADRIVDFIDAKLGKTHSLSDDFFDGADLNALRKKGSLNGLHASGFVHAARAGQFSRIIDMAQNYRGDDPDNRKFYPMDFLYTDTEGYCVLDYLAARRELHLVFDHRIWADRLKQAEALYQLLPVPHKLQVNMDNLRLNAAAHKNGKRAPKIRRRNRRNP